jgi:hypothetical protein
MVATGLPNFGGFWRFLRGLDRGIADSTNAHGEGLLLDVSVTIHASSTITAFSPDSE